jgi:hypothetical protein
VSFDLSPDAAPATYRDSRLPDGVTVDGQSDTVPASPLPRWSEVTFAQGRTVTLPSAPPGNSAAKVYYKDDGRTDRDDTGDQRSFGDVGVSAPDLDKLLASGFPGQLVFLPNGLETSPEDLLAQAEAPLVLEVTELAPPAPTGPVPTDTALPPVATDTPTATRPAGSGTEYPSRAWAYLPVLLRGYPGEVAIDTR